MLQRRKVSGGSVVAIALMAAALGSIGTAQAKNDIILYTFTGANGDGNQPFGGLVTDKQRNFYGTTGIGGTHGYGTVFKFAPGGAETVLYSFGDKSGDGCFPSSGLVMDKKGNLYGTTRKCGASGLGTVYQVAANGSETVLYSFKGDRGSYPASNLIMDKHANLYGTTTAGGDYGYGTVFVVATGGKEKTIYSFMGGADGADPEAGLIMDAKGNLYGTTYGEGGQNGDFGTIFKLAPNGAETVLHNFCSLSHCADGSSPEAGLIMDANGNLYGTAYMGGANGDGAIYEVTPNRTETVLYSCDGNNGNLGPAASVIMDTNGHLYGTNSGASGDLGNVFELAPDGTETVLHAFAGGSDGSNPYGPLLIDAKGNLFGTTAGGGTDNDGTIFEVKKH